MDASERRALALWTAATPSVSAFVHALLADRAEREDVLQEVALAVFESFERYDPRQAFLPWALTIARRKVSDALRRKARGEALLADTALEALGHALHDVAEREDGQLVWLEQCLARLEGRAREACQLRYVDGLKPAAIAERLGLRANAASKLLQRVREDLRACIEQRQRAAERA
jgi:RNA polymerase sigma-70 factor (ECF subfamily)